MLNECYLETEHKSSKVTIKYPLKFGFTTIGTALWNDIRLKSKKFNDKEVSCLLECKENGEVILENKCKFPILYNGSKMKKIQLLKSNDEFIVDGKHFRIINNSNKIDRKQHKGAIQLTQRQSVMPNFKVKPESRIPVPSRSTNPRLSLSVTKTKKVPTTRFCSTALTNKKRNPIFNWETTETSNRGIQKDNHLGIQVRKSLFLKHKVVNAECSISESEKNFKGKRGVKRGRQSTPGSVRRVTKKSKPNEKFTFSLNGSHDSVRNLSQESPIYDSLLDFSGQMCAIDDSPLTRRSSFKNRSSLNDLIGNNIIQRSFTPEYPSSPLNNWNYSSVKKRSMRTPKLQKTPKNDMSDFEGIDKLFKTPKTLNNNLDMTELAQTYKVQEELKNDLSDIEVLDLQNTQNQSLPNSCSFEVNVRKSLRRKMENIKGLVKTPKVQKSPKNDLTHIEGIKNLFKTPKIQKSPKNDLTNVFGIKKLLSTPKVPTSPKNDLTKIECIKKLFEIPKSQNSPKNDLTKIEGIKKLFATPKDQKSPKNDLTEIRGVKKLLQTPKVQISPKNDLTDVKGVRKLLTTPKLLKSPKNDLSDVRGVKKLLKTPKEQKKGAKNDLSDVRGVKRLMRTPRVQREPKNDLSDVRGVKRLLEGNKSPKNELNDFDGIQELFASTKSTKTIRGTSTNTFSDLEVVDDFFVLDESDIYDENVTKEPTESSSMVNRRVTRRQPRTNTPAQKPEKPEKRSARIRQKKIIEMVTNESNLKKPSVDKKGTSDESMNVRKSSRSDKEETKPTRTMRKRKNNEEVKKVVEEKENEETSRKRTRTKKHIEMEVEEEHDGRPLKTDKDDGELEVKKAGRGRKKKIQEQPEETTKSSRAGRKKKAKEENVDMSPKDTRNKRKVVEHIIEKQKKSTNIRKKRNEYEPETLPEVSVKKIRTTKVRKANDSLEKDNFAENKKNESKINFQESNGNVRYNMRTRNKQ